MIRKRKEETIYNIAASYPVGIYENLDKQILSNDKSGHI